jgi:hypothetical protein
MMQMMSSVRIENPTMMIPPDPDMLKVLHEERVRRLTSRWSGTRSRRDRRSRAASVAESMHFDRHGRLQ